MLAQELHRYIGAALNPTLDTLKDIQAKDLRQQFEELDKKAEGKPTPSRHLLSEKAAAEIAAEQAAGGEGDDGAETGQGEDADEPLDAYEFAEPLDFLKSNDFPSNFDEMIVSKKWQERKEVEDALLTLLKSSPKLKAEGSGTSYDSLVDALAERIKKDANINVVLVACQCLEAMAKGLRSGFGRHKEKVLPALLEKLKEKKVTTVHVLAEALDAIFQTVSVENFVLNE